MTHLNLHRYAHPYNYFDTFDTVHVSYDSEAQMLGLSLVMHGTCARSRTSIGWGSLGIVVLIRVCIQLACTCALSGHLLEIWYLTMPRQPVALFLLSQLPRPIARKSEV